MFVVVVVGDGVDVDVADANKQKSAVIRRTRRKLADLCSIVPVRLCLCLCLLQFCGSLQASTKTAIVGCNTASTSTMMMMSLLLR